MDACTDDPRLPLSPLASQYLALLLEGHKASACRVVLDALSAGTTMRDIYLKVFEPVEVEVGRRWHTGLLTVAEEHYCTAATRTIMELLYGRIHHVGRIDPPRFVGTCVSGEQHDLGIRMVADFFEMAGWRSYYLGADVPTAELVSYASHVQAHVVGLSVTLSSHLDRIAEAVEALRKTGVRRIRVLVGGYPFRQDPDLWKAVQADGSAPDAEKAVEVAQRLMEARP